MIPKKTSPQTAPQMMYRLSELYPNDKIHGMGAGCCNHGHIYLLN